MNSILVVFYWVLLLLILVGIFGPETWAAWWPRAHAVILFILFVIIGLKLLKPNW